MLLTLGFILDKIVFGRFLQFDEVMNFCFVQKHETVPLGTLPCKPQMTTFRRRP